MPSDELCSQCGVELFLHDIVDLRRCKRLKDEKDVRALLVMSAPQEIRSLARELREDAATRTGEE